MVAQNSDRLKLWVIDRDSLCIAQVYARVGMMTTRGIITRMTEKTIWTARGTAPEHMWRRSDGQLPSVRPSFARKSDYVPQATA